MTRITFAAVSRWVAVAAGLSMVCACGPIKTAAIKSVADTLSSGSGDVFTSDDDPEVVRIAAPFALKMNESLLVSIPKYEPLLLATCSNYTSYSYAFVQGDADLIRTTNHPRAKELDSEALKLYIRAKGYCMRAMDVRFPGIQKKLMDEEQRTNALMRAEKKDVPLLYWTAASWGSAIALGLDQPDLAVDFPTVRALAERALVLDESWGKGSLHELMIKLDSVVQLGGSVEHAREHFNRAVEIQGGASTGPYVDFALGVSIGIDPQNRPEFEKMMHAALAVDLEKDPSIKLLNIINQRLAQSLLDHADALFAK